MASKLQKISELASQTAQAVTRDADGWMAYLDTASWLYKYPFDEQLFIYVQRPDATACASMELWNNTMRRWVKPGSKGIAVIRKASLMSRIPDRFAGRASRTSGNFRNLMTANVQYTILTRCGLTPPWSIWNARTLTVFRSFPHAGLRTAAPRGRHPVGQQEVPEPLSST